MSKPYTPSAWYWIVAGDASQPYSSAAAAYVPATDPAYLDWINDGGTPTRIASEDELREVLLQQYPAGILKTPADIVADYERALDQHLDAAAQSRRYNDRFTFALRAGYPGPYHAEAVVFAAWMDDCNAQAYQLLQDVQAGTATLPTVEAFIAALPVLVLP